MRKTLISIATLLVLSGVASAGGSKGTFGVGFEQMLRGPGGASFQYDGGQFHAGAFLGFANNDFTFGGVANERTDVDFGANFYFHAHSTAMSDFGVGGGLGFLEISRTMNLATLNEIYVDLGAQIRFFPVSNVALSATLGLEIGTADANGVTLDGQPMGIFGVHYFFF